MSYNNAVAAVYARDSRNTLRILMIVEKNGAMNVPGGGREDKDGSSIQTAERELAEETSNSIDFRDLCFIDDERLTHRNGTVTVINRFVYTGQINIAFTPLVNTETKGMMWARVDQFRSYRDNGKLNDTDLYEVASKKYKLRGPCVNTFKQVKKVLDISAEQLL